MIDDDDALPINLVSVGDDDLPRIDLFGDFFCLFLLFFLFLLVNAYDDGEFVVGDNVTGDGP